jgi:L-malate glycosyltransferase
VKRVLFLGAYLSKTRGTIGPGEFIASQLTEEGWDCRNISRHSQPLMRAFDSIFHSLFGKYDLAILDVYGSRVIYLTFVLSVILRIRKIPFTCVLHGGSIPKRFPVVQHVMTPVLQHSTQIFTPSQFIQKFFTDKGRLVSYLPNPFPIKKFPFKEPDSLLKNLLWIRAFSSGYNPDLAVRILNEVRKTYPEATLTMIGPDNGELKPVKELIKELGLQDAISITGPVPNDELYRYFHSHSVYLNTTSYESFGMAVMEAAACGIPIVSTSVGEIPLLWEAEKEILLVDVPTEINMADQVKRILNDKKLSQELSVNARKKAENYSWEKVKGKWIELFN